MTEKSKHEQIRYAVALGAKDYMWLMPISWGEYYSVTAPPAEAVMVSKSLISHHEKGRLMRGLSQLLGRVNMADTEHVFRFTVRLQFSNEKTFTDAAKQYCKAGIPFGPTYIQDSKDRWWTMTQPDRLARSVHVHYEG